MAGFWEHIIDSDYRQRDDISDLQQAVSSTSLEVGPIYKELNATRRRVEKLELTIEALVCLLELRLGMKREDLALMIQRVDLLDGVEDGAIGPDRSATAPKCPSCGRPVSKRRRSCIFCGAAVSAPDTRRAAARPRQVTCRGCEASIPETESYFSDAGEVVCHRCFHKS